MTGRRVTSASLMLAAGCLFLVACSGSPPLTPSTGAAATPQSPPLATQSEQTSPPSPSPTPDRNGNYAGTAQPMDTGGGVCTRPRQVSGFRVAGNSVRFGGFRGSIDSAGGLQMVRGDQWIVGQFEGTTFRGQFTFPRQGRSNAPGCSYALSLDRIGP